MGSRVIAVLALLLSSAAAYADVSISSKPTQNMSCDSGVCTATAKNAVLNAGDLQTMLASGDVTVKTGSVAPNIEITAPLTWSSTSRLTLDAQQSIIVKKPVTVTGTGSLTITTNDGGQNGDLLFERPGRADFSDLNSSLVVSGSSYTLVTDITSLAEEIAANPTGFYALANNLDATGEQFDTIPVPTEFFGIFEGLGHNVHKLHIRRSAECTTSQGYPTTYRCAAFFAKIGVDAIVRDLILDHATVVSTADIGIAAILAAINRGAIRNVSADGSVSGISRIMGGLVGDDDCCFGHGIGYSSAAVDVTYTGTWGATLGGLVAICRDGSGAVFHSHATGRVSGGSNSLVGGLVGKALYISDSYATGAVSGETAGGLAGSGVLVTRSFAGGSVTGLGDSAIAGGLVGIGYDVEKSYATGEVAISGRDSVAGGFFGRGGLSGTYDCCSYSTGAVDGGKGKAGGFLGGDLCTEEIFLRILGHRHEWP